MAEQTNNPCPEPVTCSIAVELANLRTENATMRGEVRAEFASLTEIVRALQASSEAAFDRGEKTMDDHNGRIQKLERKIWFVSGAASAISASITAFVSRISGGGHGG